MSRWKHAKAEKHIQVIPPTGSLKGLVVCTPVNPWNKVRVGAGQFIQHMGSYPIDFERDETGQQYAVLWECPNCKYRYRHRAKADFVKDKPDQC